MRIAITGSTGMIGSQLVSFFSDQGHEIVQITRQSVVKNLQTSLISWDPEQGALDASKLEGFDAVIHLAGANIGESWNKVYKNIILESRIQSTRLLAQTLAKLNKKPGVLLSASAIGYYGNHDPQEVLDEQSSNGTGFLPTVCRLWEEETRPAKDAGIRVVHMRTGVVLSRKGGALAKMWLPFQMGLGGVLGSGRQMMSWIGLDEIPLIVDFLINNEIHGAVNLVAPNAVSNKEFTKTLGVVIKRPTIFPVPDFTVKILFGEMGQTLLLEGAHVRPKVLLDRGYKFKYPDLKSALEKVVA